MVIDKTYKISAFGYFGDIIPTSENVMFFLEAFKQDGLIPSLIQEFNVTEVIPGAKTVPNNRIALMSNDGQTQIIIGTNRIDYSFSIPNDQRIVQNELVSLVNQKIVHFYEVVFAKFKKSSTRLALNTESLLVNLSNEEIENLMLKYRNPISIYSESLVEWNTHLMIRKTSEVLKDEVLNVITNISKAVINKAVNGETQLSDGFIIQTDINTLAENSNPRFDKDALIAFINESNFLWSLIITEIGC